MIKETLKDNDTVKPNNREMALRKALFAPGFNNDRR